MAKVPEIARLAVELLREGKIGLHGRNNPNGADSYHCPCCLASIDIKGYAGLSEPLDALEHKPDCKLWQLFQAIGDLESSAVAESDRVDTSPAS
ncbi:MAG: hypothetical protein K2Z81_03300 [Cyanobacteria bacterium]|nr:hypothetical protein [Cyanobacteriota bacterium]